MQVGAKLKLKADITLLRERIGSTKREVWRALWKPGTTSDVEIQAGIEGEVKKDGWALCRREDIAREWMLDKAKEKLAEGFLLPGAAAEIYNPALDAAMNTGNSPLGLWFY